jgi:hypothetical protein
MWETFCLLQFAMFMQDKLEFFLFRVEKIVINFLHASIMHLLSYYHPILTNCNALRKLHVPLCSDCAKCFFFYVEM